MLYCMDCMSSGFVSSGPVAGKKGKEREKRGEKRFALFPPLCPGETPLLLEPFPLYFLLYFHFRRISADGLKVFQMMDEQFHP